MSKNNEKGSEDKLGKVFYISAFLVLTFVIWGTISPSSLTSTAEYTLSWMIDKFGWYYMLITAFFVLFSIVLAISPYENIRLGKPDDRPDYSWISWIGMLFSAGIGVGLVFRGVAEPVLYYLDPPVGYEAGTLDAATAGLRYGAYHWALHPWAIFALVALTLAYGQFKKGRPAVMSFEYDPLLSKNTAGKIGQLIYILAVLATWTGVATAFGLSAMQITGGLSYLTPPPNKAWEQTIVIIVVTGLLTLPAARG